MISNLFHHTPTSPYTKACALTHDYFISMPSPDYFVETYLTSIKDDDCEVIVRCNGKVFYLRLSPTQFHESLEVLEHYFKCLKVLSSEEEILDDIFDDEALAWLVKPFEPLIVELAPEPPGGLGTPTLSKYFFSDWFLLTVDVDHNEFRPRHVEAKRRPQMLSVWITEEVAQDLQSWTKCYSPSEVEIVYKRPEDVLKRDPRRVCVNDGKDTFFFKPFTPGRGSDAAIMELKAFQQIAKADLNPEIRICRLHGVVGTGSDLLGMLLTFIEERFPLYYSVKKSTPPELRQQWAIQIKRSIAELHKHGLVWGDVKPHNVLVDAKDDAWLIDFGGSYTEGWVDRGEAGTVEGDLHGLGRILEFLS